MKMLPEFLEANPADNVVGLGRSAEPLTAERLARAKIAHTVRRVPVERMAGVLGGNLTPRAGDLVLARVTKLGQHKGLELAEGRRSNLFASDEILVVYGNRYAPDQFEAEVPADLSACHLVAAGGVASKVISRHSRMKPATVIEPVGLVVDAAGRRLNVADFALQPLRRRVARPPVIAAVGTSMNAGKTTSAAHLVRGLANAGLRVGAAKITGTGAPGDTNLMRDAGASVVLDFTDAGHVSTYLVALPELERVMTLLTEHLAAAGVDAIVLEVADGLYQAETRDLLLSPTFRDQVDGVLFAAGDAMGAFAGVEWLHRNELPVIAVSGLVTASPLASREANAAVDVPLLDLKTLADGIAVGRLGIEFADRAARQCRSRAS